MLLQNPLKEDESRFIKEVDGKYFLGDNELLSLTEEQKKITKTGANYYFKGKENGSEFFCHLNQEKGKFWIAETFDGMSHDVWLANNKSVTFYDNNIVFRDNKTKESFPFQKEEQIKEIIEKQYAELVNSKTFVMFKDTIRNEDSYIERKGDKWFRFDEELKPLTEEQKKITKTNAQYAVTNEKGTFFYHLNETNKQFALTETVNELGHEVWLKDKPKNIEKEIKEIKNEEKALKKHKFLNIFEEIKEKLMLTNVIDKIKEKLSIEVKTPEEVKGSIQKMRESVKPVEKNKNQM